MDLNQGDVCPEDTDGVTEHRKDSEMNNLEESSRSNSERLEDKETGNTEQISLQTQAVAEYMKDSEMNNLEESSRSNSERLEDKETGNTEQISLQTQAVAEYMKDSEMKNLEESSTNNSERIEDLRTENAEHILPEKQAVTEHLKDSEMNNLEERMEDKETGNAEHIPPKTQAVDLECENGNAETEIRNTHDTQDCQMEDLKNEDILFECDTNSKPEAEIKKNEILNEAIIKIARPLCADYRSDSDSESVDSESDSSPSSSDTMTETSSESEDDSDDSCSSITNGNSRQKEKKERKRDLTIYDLPPIEDLQISVPEDDCIEVGTITSIVDTLVVVESYKGSAALDIDTVLFLDNGKRTLGKVFDILGPITEPVYAVRFNTQEQIKNLNIEKGLKVYYAPKTPHTTFVFMSEVLKNRGSDASWKDNAEAPPELQDFSDDEEERLHRQRHPRESDGENPSPRDQNRSRKRPFTQFKQRSPQANSFRNPNFQPTRRANFQRYPPANQFTPQYAYPSANPFPFTPYRPPGPPPAYYPPRISGPPFPAFGGAPLLNQQNFQQPYYQQRAHPGPQNFGAWGNLVFAPPPPPPPPAVEQGDGEKQV